MGIVIGGGSMRSRGVAAGGSGTGFGSGIVGADVTRRRDGADAGFGVITEVAVRFSDSIPDGQPLTTGGDPAAGSGIFQALSPDGGSTRRRGGLAIAGRGGIGAGGTIEGDAGGGGGGAAAGIASWWFSGSDNMRCNRASSSSNCCRVGFTGADIAAPP
jgi:hypothetical protein